MKALPYDRYRDEMSDEVARKIAEVYEKTGSAAHKRAKVEIILKDLMDNVRLKDWTKKIT